MAMTTDFQSTFSEKSSMKLVGYDVTKEAGVGPENVDVVELHDCFWANELITYEALGLCGEGKAGVALSGCPFEIRCGGRASARALRQQDAAEACVVRSPETSLRPARPTSCPVRRDPGHEPDPE